MLTPQLILRVAGIAAFVVAALFAVLAVHYYLTQDIRGVMDDLSGKARARGVAGTRRRSAERKGDAATADRRPRPAEAPVRQGEVEPAPPAVAFAEPAPSSGAVPAAMANDAFALVDEDGSGTMLVAAASLQGAASEDDVATMVADGRDAGGASRQPMAQTDEDDMATMVAADDANEDDLATMVEAMQDADAPGASPFRMTRSLVMIHSQEIIAAREGQLL